MKRILALAVLWAVLLTGCADGTSQGEAEQSGTEMTQQEAAPMPLVEVPEETVPVSEEEVLMAYDRAVEAWSWFYRKPLPSGGDRIMVGDTAYWKVNSRQVQTMEDLRSHLRYLFSQELMEQLLELDAPTPVYRELDGKLYVREDAGRERDWSKGNQQIQVEQETETSYSVNVTVDLLDDDHTTVEGLEFWSFPYELVEDRWVFTSFHLID